MKKYLLLLIICGLTLTSSCVFAADKGAVRTCKKVAAYIHKYPAYDSNKDMVSVVPPLSQAATKRVL
jgi:hypothetical protein